MSFLDMKAELTNAIPGMDRIYAGTLINRAYRYVRDSNLWSFQLAEWGWFTPSVVNVGTVTYALGSDQIVGDATATAVWNTLNMPFITQRQFRISGYSIYNIIAYDGLGNITLDRPFSDPIPTTTNPNPGYLMYQCYIAAPVKDFKRLLSVRDFFDNYWLDIWSSRRDLDMRDPARFMTSNPTKMVGYGQDQRPNSATFGFPMFEMWPSPSTQISYMGYYVRLMPDLVANADTLPYPLTEELVLIKARQFMYEWAEARKDIMAAKGSGANYLQLAQTASLDFKARLKQLRLEDKDIVDSYMSRLPKPGQVNGFLDGYYNSVSQRAGMGLR